MKRLICALAGLAALAGAAHAQKPIGPEWEPVLIATVDDFADKFRSAPNDMAKGLTRRTRAQTLCGPAQPVKSAQGHVRDWTGTVQKLDAVADGRGILYVRIAPNVTLQTTNNDFSEKFGPMKTLIAPGTPLYDSAVALAEGQQVRFSGMFAPSVEDCLKESSLTVGGAMTEPEFLFQFSVIAPVR